MPTHPTRTRPNRPPRLAIVVGSGGVRGVAAVGIAEVLAREGVRPDLVVGCSSGALFGATIALRMSPEDALQTAGELWSRELMRRHRWRAWLQLLAPRLAGFGDDFALRDAGLIERRIREAFGQRRLEDTPTALRIAATDAASGEAVVLTHGGMTEALRASVALPFVFPAVTIDGRRLVGGVISDPLPLAAAADARTVVALGFQGAMPRRVERASHLVAQVSTAMINNLMQARNAAARAAGQRVLHIELALERRVGLWETGALRYLYEAGRRAAQTQLPQIMTMLEGRSMRAAA
ncbi:MAG: patatin-like phospholipase family protein [Burkholderiales bacterium]